MDGAVRARFFVCLKRGPGRNTAHTRAKAARAAKHHPPEPPSPPPESLSLSLPPSPPPRTHTQKTELGEAGKAGKARSCPAHSVPFLLNGDRSRRKEAGQTGGRVREREREKHAFSPSSIHTPFPIHLLYRLAFATRSISSFFLMAYELEEPLAALISSSARHSAMVLMLRKADSRAPVVSR